MTSAQTLNNQNMPTANNPLAALAEGQIDWSEPALMAWAEQHTVLKHEPACHDDFNTDPYEWVEDMRIVIRRSLSEQQVWHSNDVDYQGETL